MKYCVCIVGLGSIATKHIKALLSFDQYKFRFIIVTSRPKESVSNIPGDSIFYADIESVFVHKVDFALITSPSVLHLEQAIIFTKRMIPVFIEKPLSDSLPIDFEIHRLLKNNPNVLVGYCLNYLESLEKFSEYISESNNIGSIVNVQINCGSYLPHWRNDIDYRKSSSAIDGGGVLLELSHEIEYAERLFGPFTSINCFCNNSKTLEIKVEDTSAINLISKNGYLVSINLNFCSNESFRNCIVYGSDGSLVWDGIANTVTSKVNNVEKLLYKNSYKNNQIYISQMKHFLGVALHGEQPRVTYNDGYNVLNIVELSKKSHITKRTIKI